MVEDTRGYLENVDSKWSQNNSWRRQRLVDVLKVTMTLIVTFKSDYKTGCILIIGLENIPMYGKENTIICKPMNQR